VWTRHFITISSEESYLPAMLQVGGGKIARSKLRRLLFNEIKQLDTMPHFMAARLLGYCLYVIGLKVHDKKYERESGLYWTSRGDEGARIATVTTCKFPRKWPCDLNLRAAHTSCIVGGVERHRRLFTVPGFVVRRGKARFPSGR
jgi:hypothetical protein